MLDLETSDKTAVQVTDPFDPRLPLVILLHGLSGDAAHMIDPTAGAGLGGLIFDRNAAIPALVDRGWHLTPGLGLYGLEMDPSAAVRGWRSALNDAGYSTLTYSQVAPRGALAPNVLQLQRIIDELVNRDPRLRTRRLVFLAHSRGGILARRILVDNASNPRFIARVEALISLHSPHQGSGLATSAVAIDAGLLALESILARGGLAAPGSLAAVRNEVNSAGYPEIMPGSATLTGLASAEPVGRIEYHTFGGTSTWFRRLWANMFTPESAAALPFPIPVFHWFTWPLPAGVLFDALSFPPLPLPLPLVTELQLCLAGLAALTPELRNGAGDLLVADGSAHLPFSQTRRSNPLNHAEALYHPTLQQQVIEILERFRRPPRAVITPVVELLLS